MRRPRTGPSSETPHYASPLTSKLAYRVLVMLRGALAYALLQLRPVQPYSHLKLQQINLFAEPCYPARDASSSAMLARASVLYWSAK
jgi:hypothetical protein